MSTQQQKGIRLTVISLVIVMAVILGLFVNKILQPRVLSPKEMVNNGAIMFSTPREIGPFSLLDQNKQPFVNQRLKGKWTLVFFGFTHCPDICPTTLASFNELSGMLEEGKFADDTQFLLVSLDPARDTPEKLKTYVEFFNPDFTGVTGEFLAIHRFATQLNVAFQKVMLGDGKDPANYTVDHSGHVALINPQGHYHGFFKSPIEASKLALTYQSVRVENG